jgi:hypothetical protein
LATRAERITNAFGLVLVLVLATYVIGSLVRYTGWSAVAISAFACSAGVVAFLSSEAHPAVIWLLVGLGAAAVASAVIAATSDHPAFLGVAALLQTLILIGAIVTILRAIVSELKVDFRSILGAISVYMMFGLTFTSLYVGIDRL